MSPSTRLRTLRSRVEDGVATATEVRFDPGADTAAAALSLLALWGIYYYQSTSDSVGSLLLFLLVGNLGLTVLFPIYYVCHRRSEPLSAVGVTTDGWRRALLASTVGGLALSPGLLFADESPAVLLPHVIAVGLMLWEPLFVHGWLQIRFERAFGAGPGVALAAASFALFHVGAVAPADLLALLAFGSVHGALFRAFDRNLLVLWPVLWAVGSGRGTLDTVVFGWEEVTVYLGMLLVAGAAIYGVKK